MTPSRSTATVPPAPAAFGLNRPTVVEARQAIERVYGAGAGALWHDLAETASEGSRQPVTVEGIVAAMQLSADGVVRLCAQAMHIRLRSYEHLAAASALVD